GPYLGRPVDAVTINVPVVLGVDIDAEGAGTLTIHNTAGATIEALASPLLISNPNGAVTQGVPSAGSAIVTGGSNVTINNDGTIRVATAAGGALSSDFLSGRYRLSYAGYGEVAAADLEGVGGGAIDTFFSTDNVVNGASGVIVGGIALRQGNDTLLNQGSITGNLFLGSGNDRVTNVGTITGDVSLGDGNDIYVTLLKDFTVRNAGMIDGGRGGDTLIMAVNEGGSLQDYASAPRINFEFVALGGEGTVTSTGDALLPVVQIAGNVTLAAGSVVNAGQTFAFRSDASVPLDNAFTNLGTINGSVALNMGNDTFANYGTLNGSLDLGDGDDTFVQGINAVFTGTADGGLGRDTFTLDINGGGRIPSAIYDQLINFEVLGITGTGTIITDAPLQVETIELAGDGGTVSFGADSVIQTQGATAITGSAASDIVNNAGTINGNVDLGDGDNTFVNAGATNGNIVSGGGSDSLQNAGTIIGDVNLGEGDNSFVNTGSTTGNIVSGTGSDSLRNDGTVTGNVDLGEGDNGFVNTGTTNGTIVSGSGSDRLENAGTINGNVDLGSGDNGFVNAGITNGNIVSGTGSDSLANAGTITGSVDTGAGDDAVTNAGAIAGDVNLDGSIMTAGPQVSQARLRSAQVALAAVEFAPVSGGNDVFTSSGSIGGSINAGAGDDSVTLSGSLGGNADLGDGNDTFTLARTGTVTGNVDMGSGSNVFTAAGSIGGSAVAGGGADSFTLSGTVGQAVDLGAGNDILDLQGDWAIGGIATGGLGSDILRLGSTGTEAAPRVLDLARFQSFEQLDVQTGVNKLSGTATISAINVNAGRLIGAAGSVLSGNVVVASAGTFGSAGTVNGNIAVSGTLSPGASPATMTVNGNVSLSATSNTVFEFTPTVSDALIINGSLSIASGAKLTMTGNRPITPGIYTMVSTTQGITGSFGTNITRDSTVLGVLRQSANAIELVGLFQLQAGANVQATAVKDYLNGLLVAGQASSGVINAFPALIGTDGFARPAQLQTLSPEPYADAAQLGIENGLSIARALRQAPLTGRGEDSGLFVFGQGYGSWRNFAGDARGVARADVNSYGFLGGLGYGNDTFGVSVFVGRSDSRQRISDLGARNDADGLFAGGRLHFALDGVTAGATIVFDRAEGDTVRNPAVGGAARSHYDLHGTTADAWIGYGVAVGGGWRFGPEVGVTSVSVSRGSLAEAGGGAFGLSLRRESYDAVFLNGSFKLQGPENGRVRPWIAGGVRYRASGDAITATASLNGATRTFTVGGVERDRTLPYAGVGLSFDLGKNASMFLNGDAEFSGSNALQNVSAGVVFRF
ncbi:MAG: autotransporter domain-containing protein, partial [Novosphingobium sp.]|nr:autotransporter domain-containing protein [Novosphingobium sp.]